jgi:hypothetical protein
MKTLGQYWAEINMLVRECSWHCPTTAASSPTLAGGLKHHHLAAADPNEAFGA